MTTVLLADRDGSALGPLSEKTVPALLPLRGAPVLERALEALVSAGIRAALVVVGPRGAEIEKRFGKGIRWGIALEYVRRGEDETTGAVLRRLEQRLDGETLVLRGDSAVEEAFGEFARRAVRLEEPVVAAVSGERLLGMWRVRPEALKKLELPREPADAGWKREKGHAALDVGLDVAPLDGLPRWRALDRGDGRPALSPRAVVAGSAKLSGGATVAEEAAVLAKAALDDVSVLPRTVVPEGVSLRGVAVSQNLVVGADGATSLLTDLLPPAGAPRGAGLGSRLAGLLLFLLSLPLWPVAFAWSFVANAGHATRPYTFAGNGPAPGTRAEVKTFRFETAIPLFRDLPLLLAVVGGSLALAGVAPLAPEEEAGSAKEPWGEARRAAPVGLLARSRLIVPASAPAEVARVVDAFDARRGCPGLVPLGLATLLSARAFTAPKGWNPDALPEGQG